MQKKYDMNLLSVTAMGIGSVVGAGIFALLGQVTLMAGNLTYASFIIAAIAALFSGYSYAKLAGKYPDSGGLTDYFHIAFKSKFVSGTLTLIYLITSYVSIAMMAKSFGIYATKLFDNPVNTQLYINIFATVIILSLAVLNMLGADDVGRAEVVLVAIKFFVLLTLIISALVKLDFIPDRQDFIPTVSGFWGSVGITFFAYAGYGIITNASADVKNPHFTISAAIYLTILLVAALYISLAFVILNYLPAADLKENANTVVTLAAQKLFGSWGYGIMFFAAIVAFISGISATYFSVFRITYALSQQKILPPFYHKKFWQRGTYGNLLSITLLTIATIIFDFNAIVNLASAAYLVSYLAVFAANWRLRKETKSSSLLIILGMILMMIMLIAFLISIYFS